MKASLAVCIFAALLATGSCLECEVCEGPGTSCSGTVQTCAAGFDSCGIIVIVGMNEETVNKGCLTSSECKAGPFTMYFGDGLTVRKGIACCLGDACRTTTVTVPPADPKPNGRRCPACISVLYAPCSEETIQCTGSNTRCIEITETGTFESISGWHMVQYRPLDSQVSHLPQTPTLGQDVVGSAGWNDLIVDHEGLR
ncbi:phospholipase A2 inhibitor NAI-like [Chelonoidis abingdonii]|uniref:phospholipase A2 inhibitor NAI-like n=1 Tax=Chelonoidis abingdonii TaxID=106734 RepID=UPI003F497071